jgi:hypothetical protein
MSVAAIDGVMLASNFDGLLPFIFGVPVVIVLLGLVSLIPAAYGHWSALPLAVPCTLLGLILIYALFADGRPDSIIPVLWILFPAPFLVGSVSIGIWAVRRRRRSD